jgi:hypothetical protein
VNRLHGEIALGLALQLAFLAPVHAAVEASDSIPVLKLSVPQNDYVLGEPVKFGAELHNSTNDTFPIIPIDELSTDMKYTFFEVTYPDGHIEFRRFQELFIDQIIFPEYPGEPLLPGASVYLTFYPNVSRELHPEGDDPNRTLRVGRTFDSVGEYQFRVCYCVSDYFTVLWRPKDGTLFSNAVTLTFHKPDSVAAKIIEALWAKGGGELCHEHVSDDDATLDQAALEGVIAKFPEHPLTKYARYYLAKTCMSMLNPERDTQRGVDILEELARDHPTFRFHETHTSLAYGYMRLERKDDAMRVLDQLQRELPYLKDDCDFVNLKIAVRCAPHHSGCTGKTMAEWQKARIEGDQAAVERILRGD